LKRFFRNKFTIVITIIAVLLAGTASFISALGYTSYIRNAVGIVLSPVQNGANHIFDTIENIIASKNDYEKLLKENEELKLKLEEQADTVAKAEVFLDDYEKLKDYLGVKDEIVDIQMTDAEVLGQSNGNHLSIITLNRGNIHGIVPGMPVIDKYGLIGRITEVGLNWCKAATLTEPDFSVGINVERTGEKGITKGTFELSYDGLISVSFLPSDTDIKEGDRLFTSSDSAMFPEGLFVGTVVSVETNDIERETVATVRPSADLKDPHYVMIVTGFENKYE